MATMTELDQTHDPKRQSFVASANGHADFPIQNLPLGVFNPAGDDERVGVAIGDSILDLPAAFEAGLFDGDAATAAEATTEPALNWLFELGAGPRRALRARLSDLLAAGSPAQREVEKFLYPAGDCTLDLPAVIGDYTDFYVGIHHATNVGKLFRPDNPLLPNYKYMPIGYHGRASSIIPSGTPVRRPQGQSRAPDKDLPAVGPSRRLDYELELGIWIGSGNALGEPVGIAEAAEHVAGYCLLNDWSARDIQAWEYQPLGPFLAKSFASTISPWVVTPEALAPFRIAQPARPAGDPAPFPYLWDDADQRDGAFDLELEVLLSTQAMRDKGLPPHRLALSNTRYMYWTVAQMIAHHTSNGCNLQPGDFLGSGTLSGPDAATAAGSILEATEGGRIPVKLPSGEERRFLEDGDEVIFTARGRREGFATIGFGACRATVLPA
jgi:fumarylacetoacetase